MARKRVLKIGCYYIFLTVLTCLTFAQQPTTGIPPLSSVGGGPFDTVNFANLDVHFSIPIFSRAGKGMSFYYSLSYDSLVWVPVQSGGTTAWLPSSTWGWGAQTDSATGRVSYPMALYAQCIVAGRSMGWLRKYGPYTYYDRGGTSHTFPIYEITTPDQTDCPEYDVISARAPDNSGFLLSSPGATGPFTVTSPSGIAFAPPTTITDANNNTITASVNGSITTFTDTLGTTALKIDATNPNAVKYEYTAPNGGTATVTVNYSTYYVATNFNAVTSGGQAISEYYFPNGTPTSLASSVVMADGSQYSFTYEPTNGGASGTVTGRLASVNLPTGGTISYSYAGSGCGNNSNCIMADGSPTKVTRTLGGGTWTYSRSIQSSQQLPQTTTVVIDPLGNETDANFSGIYETERNVFEGSGGSRALLKGTDSCYNGNWTSCQTAVVSAPITFRAYFDALDEGSAGYATYQYWYDQYGNLTQEYDNDYSSGNPVIREVITAYNSTLCGGTSDICDHPASVQVNDGSGHQKSYVTYAYDNGSNTKGNLTSVSQWVSSSQPNLVTQYTYNTGSGQGGTLASSTDPNGTVTNYSGYTCNGAFPTSVSAGGLTTGYTYNCTGGVVTSIADSNSPSNVSSTSYTDHYFWRPSSATDARGYTTNYSYYNPTQFESVMNFNNGSSTKDQLVMLDNMGRLVLKQTRQGPGSSTFDTLQWGYDAAGHLANYTLPFSGPAWTGGTNPPLVAMQYDGLGRVTAAGSWPAGATTTYSYPGNDILVTSGPAPGGEKAKSRQYEYNAIGQLMSVCELLPSGGGSACGQYNNPSANAYQTSYSYDPLGNLMSVSQSSETRGFSYDGLSRMISESNPETTQSGSGGTSYYTYDSDGTCGSAKGSMVKRIDPAGNVTCYAYDGLHRLTGVTYPSGPNVGGMQPKSFYYDLGNPLGVTVSNPKGHLTAAVTGNNVTAEAFSYDQNGEITDLYELAPHGGWYHITQSYDANGGLNGLQGFNGTGTLSPFSLPLSYNTAEGEGRPQGLWDAHNLQADWWGTTYNVAGQPQQVDIFGGSEIFQYDLSTDHMTQWQSTPAIGTQTGNLYWNANGTLQSLQINDSASPQNTQNCSYIYDDVARLKSANCGSTWSQTFTYDAFGNITKAGSSIFNPGYNNTGLNNHVSGFSYDGMGNVVNDGVRTYSYDAEGRPVSVGGVTVTYDALGRVVESNNGGTYTQTVYTPGGGKFAHMNGTAVQQYYLPLAGGLTAVYNGGGLQYYRHADWLGTTRMAITPSGSVYYDGAYAPFGENYVETGTSDRSFTGQTQDTAGGIYDFLFRQQSSAQGRWLTPDPSGMAAVDITNPQTWNRYAYAGNNPLNATDPLGLYLEDCSEQFDPLDCGDFSWFLPICLECVGNGGGGGGTRGGGGGGGTPVPPTPVPPPSSVNYGDESLGVPSNLQHPWGTWSAIVPNAQCGDITCPPIGSGFGPGDVLTWPVVLGTAARGVSLAVSGTFGAIVLLLSQTGDAPPHGDVDRCWLVGYEAIPGHWGANACTYDCESFDGKKKYTITTEIFGACPETTTVWDK